MDPDCLRRVCAADKIKGIYIMPECQNPTASTMTLEKRREIAAVIRENGLVLIEDDTYAFLQNTGFGPVSAFAPEQSVYISGTSKALSAGLRVSFLSVAEQFRAKTELAIRNINLMTSPFNTEVVAHLIRAGLADDVIRRKQDEAERRNAAADQILAGFDLRGNRRDYFRWLMLPGSWTGQEFELHARAHGVNVFCAEKFVVGSGAAVPAVRISLSAAPTIEKPQDGLEVLRGLLREKRDTEPFII